MQSFLIIQTAFIGDVILATSVIEKLHQSYPGSKIDFLLRKGNEGLLKNNPFINEVIIWDKKQNKLKNLFQIVKNVRTKKYDHVINIHRFASSGIITALSGSKNKTGFDKNPFSFFYTKKVEHKIGNNKHEIERNHELIKELTGDQPAKPKLYPTEKDLDAVKQYKNQSYICIAPTSVWFTKQLPKEKWIELINKTNPSTLIYLLGAASDSDACEQIKNETKHPSIINLSGKLSFLESAALMLNAQMNYVNDSAPMHIASAMNAPVSVFFCSTVPAFGFGPLSDNSRVIEIKEKLGCRPCGLHGYNSCPKGHFKCGYGIEMIP